MAPLYKTLDEKKFDIKGAQPLRVTNFLVQKEFVALIFNQIKCMDVNKLVCSLATNRFNPTPVWGVYITPPAEKWQLLLKIVILKSPNFVTFPIYL